MKKLNKKEIQRLLNSYCENKDVDDIGQIILYTGVVQSDNGTYYNIDFDDQVRLHDGETIEQILANPFVKGE